MKFESKINLPCVNPQGLVRPAPHASLPVNLPTTRQQPNFHATRYQKLNIQVDFSSIPSISQWKREFTLETALVELRRYVFPIKPPLLFYFGSMSARYTGTTAPNNADKQIHVVCRPPQDGPTTRRLRLSSCRPGGIGQAARHVIVQLTRTAGSGEMNARKLRTEKI